MSSAHEIVRTGISLTELFRRYPNDTAAEAQFEMWRWPNGVTCPHCGGDRITRVVSRRPMPYRCKDCRRHFSVTSGTVMHGSKLGSQTWLLGLFLLLANPKGRSSVQLAADLGITQKSAWHLAHRIRAALDDGGLGGSLVRSKPTRPTSAAKPRTCTHANAATRSSAAAAGPRNRCSMSGTEPPIRWRSRRLSDTYSDTLGLSVRDVAAPGARVFTDGGRGYHTLQRLGFRHERVSHAAGEYVRGEVHTNSIENYWSHLKRTWVGTYHYWSPEHLDRYIGEHSWRFNRRGRHVLDRMGEAAAAMDGRSLTYRQLAGSRG